MSARSRIWGCISGALFEYETAKVVQISSWKIGIIFRGIQLCIIVYIIMWVMVYEKGYQTFDTPISGVTAKVKGIQYTNYSHIPGLGSRIWDVADYVVPPQQNSAFFVTTNVVVTEGQSQGMCDESSDVYGVNCTVKPRKCRKGRLGIGSGLQTGRCVKSSQRNYTKTCEVLAWCPTEDDRLPDKGKTIFPNAKTFTVLIKNSIEFTKFGVRRRNILNWMERRPDGKKSNYLHVCRFNPRDKKMEVCPIFVLGDIIKYAKADEHNLWEYGGMVAILVHWECNLDHPLEQCLPKYDFRRLDDEHAVVGKGWNFRRAHHYAEDGVQKRILIKTYGIQFFIFVTGRGGKFDILTFTMNLGSGLALLGVSTVLCDVIVLNILKKRKNYRNAKVDSVNPPEKGGAEEQQNSRVTRPDRPVSQDIAIDKMNNGEIYFNDFRFIDDTWIDESTSRPQSIAIDSHSAPHVQ